MLRVVLVHPQIPPNTGNIARTCAATGTPLHLIEPLGFRIDDRHLKRAGIDYWPHVQVTVHPNLEQFAQVAKGRWVCFDTNGTYHLREYSYQPGDWLLFGCESEGLPPALTRQHPTVYIPMAQTAVRSLNLSVSVAIALYEARRQLGLDEPNRKEGPIA